MQIQNRSRVWGLVLVASSFACGVGVESELDTSYGGVTDSDEAPLFGDDAVRDADRADRERHPDRRDGDVARDACRHGFVRAVTSGIGDDGVGHFVGVALNGNRERIGHVRGVYGVREGETPVVFGKIIARDGRFRARFRGTFERTARLELEVRARIHVRGSDANGVLGGTIHENPTGRGSFEARFAIGCAEHDVPTDRMPPERDDEERDRPERTPSDRPERTGTGG